MSSVAVRPLPHSVLYLRNSRSNANPKVISARTSYLWVRLAYHPYPQLIRAFCNIQRFGPPRDITPASTWPWIAHPVSGLLPATIRPFQTRFRFGSPSLVNLATYRHSQAHSSKGTPSWPPCGDDTLTVCKPTVSGTISLPSRGAFHLSLTVLVHYRSPRNT